MLDSHHLLQGVLPGQVFPQRLGGQLRAQQAQNHFPLLQIRLAESTALPVIPLHRR